MEEVLVAVGTLATAVVAAVAAVKAEARTALRYLAAAVSVAGATFFVKFTEVISEL